MTKSQLRNICDRLNELLGADADLIRRLMTYAFSMNGPLFRYIKAHNYPDLNGYLCTLDMLNIILNLKECRLVLVFNSGARKGKVVIYKGDDFKGSVIWVSKGPRGTIPKATTHVNLSTLDYQKEWKTLSQVRNLNFEKIVELLQATSIERELVKTPVVRKYKQEDLDRHKILGEIFFDERR